MVADRAASRSAARSPTDVLAFRSRHAPLPLTDLERLLVLITMAGTTGWHYAIMRHERYAPYLANYASGAAGRTFPVRRCLSYRRDLLHRRQRHLLLSHARRRRAGRSGDRDS